MSLQIDEWGVGLFKMAETSYAHLILVSIDWFKKYRWQDPNPWDQRVRRCDRESFPKAKCIMSLFVMGQTEPKMDV